MARLKDNSYLGLNTLEEAEIMMMMMVMPDSGGTRL